MRLIWLNSAVDDLCRLREFLGQKNMMAANKAANKIIESTNILIQHPNLGKPVSDLPDYRDFAIPFGAKGYVLRYRLSDNKLYIVHIKHYNEVKFLAN